LDQRIEKDVEGTYKMNPQGVDGKKRKRIFLIRLREFL
jgi:hypothetical protein